MVSQETEVAYSREARINHQIRAREVRVIGAEGEQLGVMPLYEALKQVDALS
jgi:translation initiation factor IF-3